MVQSLETCPLDTHTVLRIESVVFFADAYPCLDADMAVQAGLSVIGQYANARRLGVRGEQALAGQCADRCAPQAGEHARSMRWSYTALGWLI